MPLRVIMLYSFWAIMIALRCLFRLPSSYRFDCCYWRSCDCPLRQCNVSASTTQDEGRTPGLVGTKGGMDWAGQGRAGQGVCLLVTCSPEHPRSLLIPIQELRDKSRKVQ